jgi:hypothetical protein
VLRKSTGIRERGDQNRVQAIVNATGWVGADPGRVDGPGYRSAALGDVPKRVRIELRLVTRRSRRSAG